MPVTTRASPVKVKSAPKIHCHSAEGILKGSCSNKNFDVEESEIIKDYHSILSSSFNGSQPIQTSRNGFVSAVLDAYLQHNHLVLRPEDLWFAILTQFSFYVNKHAEELRGYFVEHEGKKKLHIIQNSMDLEAFALTMTELIARNVKDPSLREWIMPSFSTTTRSDEIAAAIIMMGTLQKYFAYFDGITCGIPSVTLLGEKQDWEDILERVGFLARFEEHEELLLWNSFLTSIVSKFVQTFDEPDGEEVVQFWQRAVHQFRDCYSGDKKISGWIQAFCFWDTEGVSHNASHLLRLEPSWRENVRDQGEGYWLQSKRYYFNMGWDEVPAGYTHVPVHMDVCGDKFKAVAVAGSVGWKVVDSESVFAETRGRRKETLWASKERTSARIAIPGIGRSKGKSESTLSGSTLASNPSSKKSVLKTVLQSLCCVTPKVPSRAPRVQHPPLPAPSKRSGRSRTVSKPQLASWLIFEVPQISDLSELKEPWEYEKGGQKDTLQPVAGWWVVRSIEGTYGRDPDCPGVQFDSDASDYNADLPVDKIVIGR